MKFSNSTKKTVIAIMLGLSLASTTGGIVNAYADSPSANQNGSSEKSTASALVQSISDSTENGMNIYTKYGGCGLNCAGCSLKCF